MGRDISFQYVLRRRRSSLARPEVQAIFDKHVPGNTRRLGKDDAIQMLSAEFGIDGDWAEQFFAHFDADNNGVFSLWKFQHFYTVVGANAPKIVSRFCELDTNGDRLLEIADVKEEISKLQSPSGEDFTEKEIEFFLKATVSQPDQKITIGQYSDLLYRIQMYKRPPKRG